MTECQHMRYECWESYDPEQPHVGTYCALINHIENDFKWWFRPQLRTEYPFAHEREVFGMPF